MPVLDSWFENAKRLARMIKGRVRSVTGRLKNRLLSLGMPSPDIGTGKFIRTDRRVHVKFQVDRGASIELRGNVLFQSDLYQRGSTRILLGEGAKLRVLGDFVLGPDIVIKVGRNAELVLGGCHASSGSGITSSTRILVRERVEIGRDAIIAWGVFITDCDWHSILGRPHTKPTFIGNNVWLAHGVSVLKGSLIGDGSVVAAHGVCTMNKYPSGCVLGGVPARVLSRDVEWDRELL